MADLEHLNLGEQSQRLFFNDGWNGFSTETDEDVITYLDLTEATGDLQYICLSFGDLSYDADPTSDTLRIGVRSAEEVWPRTGVIEMMVEGLCHFRAYPGNRDQHPKSIPLFFGGETV